MRSLKRRFQTIEEKNSQWSSYICFVEAVRGQQFSASTIRRWFYVLVEKDDYRRKEKGQLLAHMEDLTKAVRTTKIEQNLMIEVANLNEDTLPSL